MDAPKSSDEKSPTYRWVIAAVCFLFMFVAMGLGNAPNGQYLSPVTEALGFSRADFSMTFSMRYMCKMFSNLLWAVIFVRLGPRGISALGFVCLSAAFFMFSAGSSLFAFFAGGALQGIALALCTNTTCAWLVDNWFDRNQGMVLGVVYAASGLGGGVGNFLVAGWIAAMGWRNSYRLTAVLILVLGVALSMLVRPRRKEHTAASGGNKRGASSWSGTPMEVLKRQPYFYVLFVLVFVMGWLCNPVYTAAPAHLVDRGFDPVFAGQMTGLMFIVLGVAKILYGMMYDRLGLKPVFLLCCAAGIVSMLILAWADTRVDAVVFAVLLGFAMPVETILVPLLVSDLLGRQVYTAMIGIFFAVMAGGIAAGNPLINVGYAAAGSYTPVLVIYAGLFAVCAAAFLWCQSQRRKLQAELS
jgi:MFS family permease